jgi:cation diffusion facilitator CzcD-associated flavoprotein CzcO
MTGHLLSMAKKVVIIGAGPSGLVAAKSLIHDHPNGTFEPVIFEKGNAVGGLWPVTREDADGLISPDMHTNQSKHIVCFSDLAWEEEAPLFPKAWQVGQYLERYTEKYVKKSVPIRFATKVAQIQKESSGGWKLSVQSLDGAEEHVFDHVIVASGFFGRPKIPQGLEAPQGNIPIIHSSQFRTVKSLLAQKGLPGTGGKILIVGGQMSGVEIAASMAHQLSSLVNSPFEADSESASGYSVHHLVSKPLWILPLHFPTKPMKDEGQGNENPVSWIPHVIHIIQIHY